MDKADDSWFFKDYSDESIRYKGNEKEFIAGRKFHNPNDDKPPRCRSCGGADLTFYIANNERFWHCHNPQCQRQSGEAAQYNEDDAIPPPHADPFMQEALESDPRLKDYSLKNSDRCPSCGSNLLVLLFAGMVQCANYNTM